MSLQLSLGIAYMLVLIAKLDPTEGVRSACCIRLSQLAARLGINLLYRHTTLEVMLELFFDVHV